MLTALVSLDLMRKTGMLQYYQSIKNLFDNWADILEETPELITNIHHGVRDEDPQILKPIYEKLKDFHDELIYLIRVMPEVVTISRTSLEERLHSASSASDGDKCEDKNL